MPQDPSKTVKAGKRTYFLDVKAAKNGEKYLAITESLFQGEDKARERSRILVFADAVDDFVAALSEIAQNI